MDAIHYQKWRAEMMKVDISNSYKNEIQKFLKIVINWAVKTYGFNMNKFLWENGTFYFGIRYKFIPGFLFLYRYLAFQLKHRQLQGF